MEKIANKKAIKFLAGFGIIIGIAIAMLMYSAWPLMTGKTIILDTRPVDPFDLLRGQYMTINYEISQAKLPNNTTAGDTVYVAVEPDKEGIYRFKRASLTKPSEGIFLRGTVQGRRGIEYGIEQYFFERGAQLPTQNITVEAKVSASGRAKIVQLLQNGKPAEIKYREQGWRN